MTYSYAGNLLTGITRGAASTAAATTSFTYTGNLLTSITTPATQTWTLAYDSQNRLSSITSPISGTVGQPGYTPAYTTQFTYSSTSTQVVQGYGTSAPIATTYTLDGWGEATAIADAVSDTTTYTYDSDHDVTSVVDPNSNSTQTQYTYIGSNNSVGLPSTITGAAVNPLYPGSPTTELRTTNSYDPTSHNLLETEYQDNQTSALAGLTYYTYNTSHDLLTTTQLVNTTVSGGTTTYYWREQASCYDSYGELSGSVDGRGITVANTTTYTANPGVAVTCAGNTYDHSYTYTASGDQHTSVTPSITTTLNGVPSTGPVTTTFSYDGDGDQTAVQSPNGPTTSYGYDHLGRQVSTALPPVTLYNSTVVTPTSTVAYDGDGNVVTSTDAAGDATTSSYDPLGRLISSTNPISGTTYMTYNATESCSARDPQGNVTTYSYDTVGRLTTVVNAKGDTTFYQYDNMSHPIVITTSNGGLTAETEAKAYDGVYDVTTDALLRPGGSWETTTNSYDLFGNLVRAQDPGGTVTFTTHDLVGQVIAKQLDGNSADHTPPAGTR